MTNKISLLAYGLGTALLVPALPGTTAAQTAPQAAPAVVATEAATPVPAKATPEATKAVPTTAAPSPAGVAAPVAQAQTSVAAPAAPTPAATPAVQPIAPEPVAASTEEAAETVESGYIVENRRRNSDHLVNLEKSRFKPGTGLHFESADKDFSLATRLRGQFRYTAQTDGEGSQRVQFRRARLQFKGNLFGKGNKFKIEFALSPQDMGMKEAGDSPKTTPLLDMYFDFSQLRDLTLRVGQYKVPFNRQRVVSSGDLRFVDRSIVNKEFNVDRDLGLDIRSKNFLGLDTLRYYAGIYAGEGRNTFASADFGMMYLARLEYLPFGMFKDYKEGGFERVATPKLSLGVGYVFIENAKKNQGIKGKTPADNGTTDTHNITADAVFRVGGFSVETEFAYRSGSRNNDGDDATPLARPRNGWGLMGQAGYLLPHCGLEMSVRAGLNRRDNDRSAMTNRNEYGVALSYYFANHPFKLQADYFRLGNQADSASRYRSDQVVRVQLQASL